MGIGSLRHGEVQGLQGRVFRQREDLSEWGSELYKEYELDQDEIAFIETNIKAIEDDDCDGLSGDKEVSHV